MLKESFCGELLQLAGGLACTCFCVGSSLLQPGAFIICKAWWGGAREHFLLPKLTERGLFARFILFPFTVSLNAHVHPRYGVRPLPLQRVICPTGHVASACQLQAKARVSVLFSIELPKMLQHGTVSVLPGAQRTEYWLFVEEVSNSNL